MLPIPQVVDEPKAKVKKAKETTKTEKTIAQPLVEEGMVMYADAGTRPNPGFGGWGLHGYTYCLQEPKKGSGNPNVVLTKNGYQAKNAQPKGITPIRYYDAYGTIAYTTNNGAEVVAAANAMGYAADLPIKKLQIITDSKYVVTGSSDYLPKWKSNDWKKSDGELISNKENWQTLDKNLAALVEKGVEVKVTWVKGHNGDQGNELADKHATIGVLCSTKGLVRQELYQTEAQGYWGAPEDKHPLLCQRRIYFTTNPKYNMPGEYYLGEHGKDDELLGKRMADGVYGYIVLKQPDLYIEMMRTKQLAESDTEDAIIMGRLDRLFSQDSKRDLERFGEHFMYRPDSKRLDMHLVDNLSGDPLTKALNPPRLALRAVEAVNALKGIMLRYEAGDEGELTQTDITEQIYEKDKKEETKLHARFVSGFTDLELQVNHQPNAGVVEQTALTLTLGLDLPDRNTLKRLEKYNPKVKIITYHEKENLFRYFSYIVTHDKDGNVEDKAMFAAYYTNIKYISKA